MPMPLNVSLRPEDLQQLTQHLLDLLQQLEPRVPFTPSLKVSIACSVYHTPINITWTPRFSCSRQGQLTQYLLDLLRQSEACMPLTPSLKASLS